VCAYVKAQQALLKALDARVAGGKEQVRSIYTLVVFFCCCFLNILWTHALQAAKNRCVLYALFVAFLFYLLNLLWTHKFVWEISCRFEAGAQFAET
jgi:hypothetical protein